MPTLKIHLRASALECSTRARVTAREARRSSRNAAAILTAGYTQSPITRRRGGCYSESFREQFSDRVSPSLTASAPGWDVLWALAESAALASALA